MNHPTHVEMITVLKALIAGSITRQEAAEWATGYITHDVRVPDACLWNALELLGAADVPSTDRPFLYEDVDFLDCLSQLERQL